MGVYFGGHWGSRREESRIAGVLLMLGLRQLVAAEEEGVWNDFLMTPFAVSYSVHTSSSFKCESLFWTQQKEMRNSQPPLQYRMAKGT